MQIFIRLLSGKTISMDVLTNFLLSDVINWANEYDDNVHEYKKIMVIEDYGNELVVPLRQFLEPETMLNSLYKNGFIKEIIFLVI